MWSPVCDVFEDDTNLSNDSEKEATPQKQIFAIKVCFSIPLFFAVFKGKNAQILYRNAQNA